MREGKRERERDREIKKKRKRSRLPTVAPNQDRWSRQGPYQSYALVPRYDVDRLSKFNGGYLISHTSVITSAELIFLFVLSPLALSSFVFVFLNSEINKHYFPLIYFIILSNVALFLLFFSQSFFFTIFFHFLFLEIFFV